MGEAGAGVVEGAAGAVVQDDRRLCAALAISYCAFLSIAKLKN